LNLQFVKNRSFYLYKKTLLHINLLRRLTSYFLLEITPLDTKLFSAIVTNNFTRGDRKQDVISSKFSFKIQQDFEGKLYREINKKKESIYF